MLPDPNSADFGAALRAAREARGMNHTQLARNAQLHPVMPGRYERGEVKPKAITVAALNAVLFSPSPVAEAKADFDWDAVAAEGAKVVNRARETAVYLNKDNDVVIRQRMDYPEENEDPFLVIPLYRVRALIDRLDALLLEAHGQEDSGSPSSR